MLTRATLRTGICAAAALLCVATTPGLYASPRTHDAAAVEFVNAPSGGAVKRDVGLAVERFVNGMVKSDSQAVWMFASEEDQDAFGTERAVYDAYAEIFPAFAKAETVRFGRFWQEGDSPFVTIAIEDAKGENFSATMGFWLDDAGDWKLISCDVKPISDRVASR